MKSDSCDQESRSDTRTHVAAQICSICDKKFGFISEHLKAEGCKTIEEHTAQYSNNSNKGKGNSKK